MSDFPLTFWIYVGVTAVFAANVAIRLVAWWYTRGDVRLAYSTRIAIQAIALYSACMLTTAFAALAFSPWMNAQVALWGVRVGWIIIALIATIITDYWIAELNGHSSSIYHLWHWSSMLPKRKVAAVVLLLLTLYLVTSCAPVQPASTNTTRSTFVDGAMYGCAGLVYNTADMLLVPQTDEVRAGVLLMCRNYAEMVARVTWDTGGDFQPHSTEPNLWPYVDPT